MRTKPYVLTNVETGEGFDALLEIVVRGALFEVLEAEWTRRG